MNNVQKSFKQKAKLGLRAFASGGLLDSFNTRQRGWDAIANNGGGMGVLQNSAVDDWNAGFDARRAAEAAAPQVRRTIMPAAQPVVPDAAPQSMRGFAGGGEIDPVEAQLAAMKAKYGVGNQSQPAATAPAPQAAPQPAPRPQQKPTLLDGLRRVATGGLEQRMKAAGYQHGGDIVAKVKKGGWIEGQKGVDKVPAKIAETGENILVSDGERIVNKEQNEALEKLAAEHGMELDEYLEQSTGKPVGPKLKNGLRAAEDGWNRVHMPGDRNYIDYGNGLVRQFVEGTKRNVAGAAGLVNAGIGAVMQAPAMATDAIKNRVAGAFGYQRENPAGDLQAAQGMMNDGLASAKANFKPVMDSVAQVTGMTPKAPEKKPLDFNSLPQADYSNEGLVKSNPNVDPIVVESNPLESNVNVKGLRAAGVTGPIGGDVTEVRRDALERPYFATPNTGVRTIDTVNGKVYTGRDAKGQLHITSNLDQTPAAAEAARAKEAERITADLARQKDYFERAGAKRDLEADIADPSVRAAAALRLAQLNTEADDRIQSERNKEEMGLRRGMLDMQGAQLKENARQFDEAIKWRKDAAESAAKIAAEEKAVKDLDDLMKSYKMDSEEDRQGMTDFIHANYPGFSEMSMTERRKLFPEAVTGYKLMKKRNEAGDAAGSLADPRWTKEAIAAKKAKDPSWSPIQDLTLDKLYHSKGPASMLPDWDGDVSKGRFGLKQYLKGLGPIGWWNGQTNEGVLYEDPQGGYTMAEELYNVDAPHKKADIRKSLRDGI